MAGPPVCPTCNKRLEGGFMVDHESHGIAVARWVEGAPEKSIWTGLKLKGRRQLPMYAWRCPSCCEVRLFAPDV
ncbi:MAG TPA: hypothetical protein VJT67_00110 [Longimicrobiaceae bacterium]|nr:hypothetical protein [Longimicrobiaceae bacterium]